MPRIASSPETHSLLDRLSEQQKSCLRLVAEGMSSKEIAKAIGLSPQTVDSYLTRANAELGTSSRRESARLLKEFEASRNSGSQSEPLVIDPDLPPPAPTIDAKGWRRGLRLPPVGGSSHDLGWRETTGEILRVAVLSAAAMLGLALTMAGLFRILR